MVPTAPVAAAGLIGGFAAARYTHRRELGGVVLAGAGAWCARDWSRSVGARPAAALLGIYLAGFGGSHVLAKRIGAWPSVLSVAAVSAGAAAVADYRSARTS